ncbi:putative protein-signal peptide and transmembrane prediction [Caenispirillum salinarum AK4]|uniref:Quinol:cytochrome c oxidoreductase quinone-binding subunit 2 n=1 Tax=Caenispirillum salinarum AK4 TaxID=1238182 RepID=K9GU89_9PROT|nr:hypothetical protein [Caenispirillum salinarum]EKV29535.1 putative protein-signal peptide and transmembrane prediction [Caenispirillum salinarum AK4]
MTARRFITLLLGIGTIGVVVVLVAATFAPRTALAAWLAAVLAVMVVPLGALPLLLTWHLHKGRWGLQLGRDMEAAVATMPLVLLFLLPVVLASGALHPLVHGAGGHETHPWLREGALLARGAVYLVTWWVLAHVAVRIGRPVDAAAPRPAMASAGLILWAVTASLAGIDWVIALQPKAYSSIFGLIFLSHLMVGALGFLCATSLGRAWSLGQAPEVRGIGNMLLGAVMLWLYHEYMQWLIVWSGDLPGHIDIYLDRAGPVWHALVTVMAVLGGAVPFVLLLWSRVRRNAAWLAMIGGWFVAVRIMEAFWWVVPLHPAGGLTAALAVAALAGAGGLWGGVWLILRARHPAPRREAMEAHHG